MKKRVKLIFPKHLIREPVIFGMAKRYEVMPNIFQARITESFGEIVLELDGEEKNLDDGLASLREKGIVVEPLENAALE